MRFALLSNNAFSLLNFRGPLLAAIASRGHTVFALAPDFDAEIRAQLEDLGVEPVDISLSRTGLNPIRDARDIFALVRTLRGLELDAILSFAIKPVVYGTLAAWWCRIPQRFALIAGLGYAFGEQQKPDRKRRLIHLVAKSLYAHSLARAKKVFMQNADDIADFIRLRIADRNQLVIVDGTGVDLEAWHVRAPVTQPVTFMLAARLLREKGIEDYVEAARIVKAGSPDVRFILLGGLDSNPDGIARSEVEGWVAEGIVEWPGHVDIRPWLAEASVYVLPSYYREGIPRSIQEALASGRPVITADTPGCRETVIEGQNGFLVPPKNPGALAAAMQHFVDRPGLVIDMGRQSRLLAETRFDVRRINARMIEVMGL